MSAVGEPVFSSKQIVRWGDMDTLGHVNNTVYFRFFEEARVGWMLEVAKKAPRPPNEGPVIVTTGASFMQELTYPATVYVHVFVGKAGRSSLETTYAVTDEAGTTRYAEGFAKIVWFDEVKRTSAPLPESLREFSTNSD